LGGVDGGTADSAMRFYLAALKEADIPFSPDLNLDKEPPRGSGVRRRAAVTKSEQDKDRDDDDVFERPEGTFEIPFEVLGLDGSVFLPEDVSHHYRSDMKNSRVNNAMAYTPRECRGIAS